MLTHFKEKYPIFGEIFICDILNKYLFFVHNILNTKRRIEGGRISGSHLDVLMPIEKPRRLHCGVFCSKITLCLTGFLGGGFIIHKISLPGQ